MGSARSLLLLLIIFLVIGSEQHFIDSLGPTRATHLLSALRTAYTKARSISTANGFVEGRTEPTVAFDLAISALYDFEQLGGVRHAFVNGQHLWVIDESYAIRVKQLGSDYGTTNHSSSQQTKIDHHQALDGMEPLVYLSAGPRVSRQTGLPIDFAVVKHYKPRHSRKKVEWAIDLDDLASAGAVPTTPILPMPNLPTAPAAVVFRRGREDTTGTGPR